MFLTDALGPLVQLTASMKPGVFSPPAGGSGQAECLVGDCLRSWEGRSLL